MRKKINLPKPFMEATIKYLDCVEYTLVWIVYFLEGGELKPNEINCSYIIFKDMNKRTAKYIRKAALDYVKEEICKKAQNHNIIAINSKTNIYWVKSVGKKIQLKKMR